MTHLNDHNNVPFTEKKMTQDIMPTIFFQCTRLCSCIEKRLVKQIVTSKCFESVYSDILILVIMVPVLHFIFSQFMYAFRV